MVNDLGCGDWEPGLGDCDDKVKVHDYLYKVNLVLDLSSDERR